MFTGFLKLLAGLWSWFGRIMAAIGGWFRRPHHWWRIFALVLAFAFTAAAFVAWDARQTIVVVRQQCDAKVLAIQTECAAVESQSHLIVQQTNAEAAKQVAQAMRDAQADRDAKVAAEAEAKRLRTAATDFDKRMEQARKNPDCDALLNADVAKVCRL